MYVRSELCAWSKETRTDFKQCVMIGVKTGVKEELGVYVVYRSPNLTRENDGKLSEWIRQLKGKYVIVGDFNFPGIEWKIGRSDAR